MSVLAREIDAYQRALEAYQRQLRSYNVDAKAYNSSILTDAEGRAYVRDANGGVYIVGEGGRLESAALPDSTKIAGDYGGTEIEGSPGYYLMRINPTQQATSTISGVRKNYDNESGETTYYITDNTGDNPTRTTINQNLYRLVSTEPGYSSGDTYYPDTYTFATDASTYLTNPGEFTKQLRAKRPDPTKAQLRRLGQPGLAEQERLGLISSEIIKGGGVLSGGLVRNARSSVPSTEPPPPETPVAPPNDPWNNPLS